MVPGTGYVNRIVIGPFWQLVHSQNQLLGVITEQEAQTLPDNAKKLILMKYNSGLIKSE